MTGRIDEITREFAKGLDRVTVQHPQLSFDEIRTSYRRVYSEMVAAQKGLILEMKRRVAERVLHAAIDKGLPLESCRKYRRDMVRLGYSDWLREMEMEIMFARYLLRLGETRSAERNLRVLQSKAPPRTGITKETVRATRKVIEDLLERCG